MVAVIDRKSRLDERHRFAVTLLRRAAVCGAERAQGHYPAKTTMRYPLDVRPRNLAVRPRTIQRPARCNSSSGFRTYCDGQLGATKLANECAATDNPAAADLAGTPNLSANQKIENLSWAAADHGGDSARTPKKVAIHIMLIYVLDRVVRKMCICHCTAFLRLRPPV
jgi:hypothetical protein